MAYPLVAQLIGTVKYSDGVTLFDGWVLLSLVYPGSYTFATISNQLLPQRLGDKMKIRIQQGMYDNSARVYQNQSLQPPDTQYSAAFYDNEDILLGTTASNFSINTGTFTITVPSLTKP